MRRFVLSLLLALAASAGCGPSGNPVPVTPPAVDVQLRAVLTELEKSGEPLGSGGMVIQEGIEEIRTHDPAKASALEADLKNLTAANTPSAVKSSAKAMLDKLR